MQVKIKYFSTLSELLSKKEENINHSLKDLESLISHLTKKYPSLKSRLIVDNELSEHYLILIDGIRGELSSKIDHDSTVVIMPVISGG